MSDSLQSHGLQHARLPRPWLSSGVCSCPLSKWCYLTISSSATPFSFCPQSFPASVTLPVSQLFASGGQSIGDSASVLPVNIQSGFPLGLTGLILQSTGLWRVLWPLYKHLELLYIIKCWISVSTEEKIIGIWRRYKRGQIIQIFTTLVSSL